MCLRPQTGLPLVPALVGSDYLTRETRLIALSRALAPLSLVALEDPFARAACYVAGRLVPVADAEDEEARRRSEFYWRRIRRDGGQLAAAADAPPPLAPVELELAHA